MAGEPVRVPAARGPAAAWRTRRRLGRAIRNASPGGLTAAEIRVRSQNGEDGVLQAILGRIGAPSRYFVEFGAGSGVEANAVLLAECFGWSGLMIEADDQAFAALEASYRRRRLVSTMHAKVTAANVESLFAAAGVPEQFDLLSIDIDGNDYWVWDAIGSHRPRVVVLEYNGNLDLDAKLVMPRNDDHVWDQTDYFGASLGAYRALAASKGYRLMHTESTGVNAFFVDARTAEVLSDLGPPRLHRANYFGDGLTMPHDPLDRLWLDLDRGELVEAARI